MSYSSKIQEWDEDSRNRQIATKIIDSMRKLKQNPKGNSSRRWIWELMQNAKDVAYDNDTISIEISFNNSEENGTLEFKHNGKPFSIKNLIFLINQVSAKDRDNPENKDKVTGKFGTGFLTTHLLSEQVELEGVVQEDNEPYKKVKLTLDRSGRSIEDVIQSVNKSRAQIDEIDLTEPYEEYRASDYNTIFRYSLDKRGVLVAEQGFGDLFNSLIFTLVFLPTINTVRIVHEDICFELSSDIEIIEDCIHIFTIKKTALASKEFKGTSKIAVLKRNKTSIAVEIEQIGNRILIKEPSRLTPKLFCDFPLVGSESFPFPVIINSSAFNPTEPRDCVMLTDVDDDEEILENKSIIADAVELYTILLSHASKENWGNIHLLAVMPEILERDWIDGEWYGKNVLIPVKKHILTTPIVDTQNGDRKTILSEEGNANIFFPSAKTKELRGRIWDLCIQWIPSHLPRKEDIESWSNIRWIKAPQLTLKYLTQQIEKRQHINNLADSLIKPNNPISWLNEYFEILELDLDFLKEINSGSYKIIPNQNGSFQNCSNLKIDNGIEEELKNVLGMLGEDCRNYLRHNEIIAKLITHVVKNQDEIIIEINRLLKDRKQDVVNTTLAYHYLASLFSEEDGFPSKREIIYSFCSKAFPSEFKVRRIIKNWSEDIWQEVDRFELISIIRLIAQCRNVQALSEHFNLDKVSTIRWIDEFISFLRNYDYLQLLTHKNATILPNQNDFFMHRDQIFLDDGEIDETFKDISALLGHDYRNELLDKNIFIKLSELPENRTISELIISREIMSRVTPRFSEVPRKEDTNVIFSKLSKWFRQNPEKASIYFENIHLHKFIGDDELAINIEKAEKYDELNEVLLEHDIKDPAELKELLETKFKAELPEMPVNVGDIDELLKRHGINNRNELEQLLLFQSGSMNSDQLVKQEINEDVLIQAGILSSTALERALENKWFSDNFTHTSDSKVYKFDYVQKLLNRSKENIFKYLRGKEEYNLENILEIDTTIFLISKNNQEIYLIARPSDYNQVIIYYETEKDILDYEKDWELWVENGEDLPSKISLGKILKITGINKIPLKKIR